MKIKVTILESVVGPMGALGAQILGKEVKWIEGVPYVVTVV